MCVTAKAAAVLTQQEAAGPKAGSGVRPERHLLLLLQRCKPAAAPAPGMQDNEAPGHAVYGGCPSACKIQHHTHTHKTQPDLAMDTPPQAHAASSSRSEKTESAAGPKFTKQQDRVPGTTAAGGLTGLGCLVTQTAAQSFIPLADAPEILC